QRWGAWMVLVPGVRIGEETAGRARRRPPVRLILTALGAAALPASGALAQAQPPIQPVPPTREEVERPPQPRPDAGRPRLSIEGGVEGAPCALERPEYQNIRFTPTEVVFDDLRGLPPEELRDAYAEFIGSEQPVSVICRIRDRAIGILRARGYVATVQVPEQRIAGGTLHLRVLMARLVALRVRGNAGRAERLIASYLDPLTRQEVFNRYEAER